jgi:enoyl-CoA hydratase/3-hydroxyacyl-CoA dehydrogenase
MSTAKNRPFRKLGVVGSGNMGSGIAQKMAAEGFDVVLLDLDYRQVDRGLRIVRQTLEQGVERGLFGPEQAEAVRGRIEGTTDWGRLADADLVVEAVFEDRAVKRDVFSRLDDLCGPGTLLATNTSSLSVTDLAAATRHPERVLGLHYFYHPAKNRLVEVVPGDATAPEITRRAWGLQEQMGKTPIASLDRPGFVVNRYFVPWANEAVRLLEEGEADIPTIEQAAKDAFGVGMGPFELMNVTGVPIALHAATTLGEAFGPFYSPSELLRRQVESGGKWILDGEPDPSGYETVIDRMRAVTFFVAASLVGEGVGTVEDTDIGARVGLRWPRGPFEMMNAHGVERVPGLVESVAEKWGLSIPKILEKHARSVKPFYFRLVRSVTRDGIATLTINRPHAMNALNESLVAQLHDAFRQAVSDPEVRGIVIAGAGKAFVAGADTRFFVEKMDQGDLEGIVEFTRAGQALLDDVDGSPKPVVARLAGVALGGGLELALACDAVVATPSSAMAFPETGLGIYPGLGGTQRTRRKIGIGLTKWLVFTGEMLPAGDAAAIGLVDRVVDPHELDDAIEEAVEAGTEMPPDRPALPERFVILEEFFRDHTADDLREGLADTRGDEILTRAMKRVGTKAPIALQVAETLITDGADRPLEEGLQLELDHVVEIFRTRDAYEGFSSYGRKKPVFEGR